jgi:hypothetical protein
MKSEQDVAFIEFNHHSNFVPRDFFGDIVPRLQTYKSNKPSHMNYIRNEITSNLMEEL